MTTKTKRQLGDEGWTADELASLDAGPSAEELHSTTEPRWDYLGRPKNEAARKVDAARAQGRPAKSASPKAPATPPSKDPPPLTAAAIRAMPKAEQRKLARERWDEVAAALGGTRPPGPLTEAELADLSKLDARTINEHWDQVKAELERRGREGKS